MYLRYFMIQSRWPCKCAAGLVEEEGLRNWVRNRPSSSLSRCDGEDGRL